MPDSVKNAMDERKARKAQARDIAQAVNGAGDRRRDKKGRFTPDQNAARREIAQIEVAEAELALEEREAKEDAKRHKELVRAIKANHRGLLERFMDARMVGRSARRGIDVDVDGRQRDKGRPDIGDSGRKMRRTSDADIDLRRSGRSEKAGRGIFGRLGQAGGKAASAGGTVLAMGSKAASGMLRALPGIGQILAVGLAAYDGIQGWNDKELHQEAFGLKEGQEATTGQKASAAAANILDMGGLTSGLLGMLGFDVSTADIARNLHQFGTGIASLASDFTQNFGALLPQVWSGVQNLGTQVWEGAQNIGGKLTDFASSTLESGIGMLTGLWEGGKSFIEGTWGKLSSFADNAISGAGEMLSGLWKKVTELPGKLLDGAKDVASGAIEGGGTLLSGAAAWAGEKASSAWEGAKAVGSWIGEKASVLLSPSEAHASELPTDPVKRRQVLQEAQKSIPIIPAESSQGKLLPTAQKEALPSPAVSMQPTSAAQTLPLAPTPASATQANQEEAPKAVGSLDQTAAMKETTSSLELLNENIELLTESVKEQSQLLDEELQMRMFGDIYGIQGAMRGVGDAIRSIRMGGSSGFVGGYGGSTSGGGGSFAYNPDSKIGDTIAHEESGGKGVNAIGYDRTGGTSYGKWQLSSSRGSYEEWLRLLESKGGEAAAVAQRLRAAGPTNTGGKSGAHVDAYLREASQHAELFEETQRESLLRHNYNPAMKGLKSDALRQMITGDKSLQEMMFSTSVQHGGAGAAKILNSVYRDGMSREELIRAVYDRRGTQFGTSTAGVQQSVQKRLARERDLILGMNAGEANVKALRERMSQGGVQAVQAGMSNMVAAATQDAMDRGVKYQMGAKNSAAGAIDCSGWVQEIGNNLMADMNAAMGEEVFSKEARKAFNRGASQEGAAGIVRAVSEQTGQLYTNEQLAPEMAKEGMVIGLDTGRKGWEAGRFKDIDHVVQTYRDPATGELMVSESRGGGRGVMHSRYADWYAEQQRKGTRLYGADMTAMADAGKVRPQQSTAIAESNTQAQPQQPVSVTPASTLQPVKIPTALAENAVQQSSHTSPQPVTTAHSALQQQAPATATLSQASNAMPERKPETVESVRQIDPAREVNSGQGSDNAALLNILGKILAAIEAGNRKVVSQGRTSTEGGPAIPTDYDDPAVQAMAKDMA